MTKKIKILIIFVTAFIMMTIISIDASTGYTYDHNGDPIYSSAGLTVNRNPYLANDLNIPFGDFNNPQDLHVYKNEDGSSTVYIVDSGSNNLYVFDENLELLETVSEFYLDVSKFDEDVLKSIKSSGQYVIARDTVFSIPQAMENINLIYTSELPEYRTMLIDYDVSELDYEYTIEWISASKDIVETHEGEDGPYLIATGLGDTTVRGVLKREPFADEEADGLVEVESVIINVHVSEESEEPPVLEKDHGFTLNELKDKGSINLKLNGVRAVYRSAFADGFLYLADRNNNQIVVVDSNTYEVEKLVTTPDNSIFDTLAFNPLDIVTDRAGRIYVIADNIYQGIMQFGVDGEFNRFTGVNYVQLSPWETFWRNISTEAQLSQQESIINTSFTSITVDSIGFIYATSNALTDTNNIVSDDQNMIKRINPYGDDVLKRNGYHNPMGDILYFQSTFDITRRGPSRLSGVTVNEYGVYSVIDSKMGRIFTYDQEGNLLYISGQGRYTSVGGGMDVLSNPVAIEYLNDNILVLDSNSRAIIRFEPTDITKIINTAVRLETNGDKMGAALEWKKIIEQNSNYEYAYVGIGRMYFEQGDYKEAMRYFEYGQNRDQYSRAFKLHRDTIIRKYFSPVVGTILILSIGLYIFRKVKYRHLKETDDTGMGDE